MNRRLGAKELNENLPNSTTELFSKKIVGRSTRMGYDFRTGENHATVAGVIYV
jgi:hypothetical protein